MKCSSVWVVLYQGCCRSSQCNLPDRMLRLDFSTILNLSYVIFILWLTCHIKSRISISHLSINEIVDHGKYYLFPGFSGRCFLFSVLVTFNKRYFLHIYLTSFLFKSKFIFSIWHFVCLLIHYYYCYYHRHYH